MTRIILLDIDGVLVQPGGYRAALRATVQRFIGNFHITEDLLTDLEKCGISSEWDMSPLIVAAYWDDLLAHHPMDNLSKDVALAAQQIQNQSIAVPKHIFVPEFDLIVGQYPAETAFRAGYFSHIPEALRRNLLVESRNVRQSETMRTFQHFTLGSIHYEETYNLPSEFETESLLLKYDQSSINGSIRTRLFQNGNHIAAFTARPSHPPHEVKDSTLGYAPEAELALELVGMTNVPLIAFGKLEYIASLHGLEPAKLVKPSPFQALAATIAALTGDELSALHAAYDWHVSGKLDGFFSKLPKSFELMVVEDTMGGIRSVQAAGEILQRVGFDITVRAYGLTSGISAKKVAFDQAGVPNFESWNELISIL